MSAQPGKYTQEYVEQLQEQLQQAQQEIERLNDRYCNMCNVFKHGEPVPLINWVVNNTPIVIWAIDKNGVFMMSEGKSLASLGLSPGEVQGRSVFDVYNNHPEITDQIRMALAGEQLTTEISINGCSFEVEHIPVFDQANNVVGAVGVSLDVTRRRNAEQTLRSNAQLFRDIFEALPIAVLTATADRKIEKLNPAAEQLFGYRSDAIVGLSTEILFSDKKQFNYMGAKHKDSTGFYAEDLILKKSDGSVFLSESKFTKIVDTHNQVIGFIGIHKDVTEEYRTLELRQRYEKIMQMMIDAAPVSALMLDADLNIVFANQRFAAYLGYQVPDIIGSHLAGPLKEYLSEGTRLENIKKVFETGIPLNFIDQEHERWLEHYVTPLEYSSAAEKRIALFIHDITERIRQEEQEREKIVQNIHEAVSEMLEDYEHKYSKLRGNLKGKLLTQREREVLKELASGLSTKQIAIKHQVSTKTIESQRLSLMEKLGRYNVAELTRYALREGIISLDDDNEK